MKFNLAEYPLSINTCFTLKPQRNIILKSILEFKPYFCTLNFFNLKSRFHAINRR